ncbi:hypothetical protein M9H77_08380 [Catharanthus roseus]|uniref:Uncharacterized protein n=1 Tax=Catharanthus roseus TaxID=4058 RepID=A0ACC0BXR8_CATRO|nr:hypothetical protein M9H77_08380 [Catharanthus roseus]
MEKATVPAGVIILLLLILALCLKRKLLFLDFMDSWKSTKTENQELETFIKNYASSSIKRYSYSDLKKMTINFDTEVGQGGYGSVYKGKLQNGTFVAVKVLKESKGKGEEFINEVASISKTSHVNIKALIYEFMPNGSLSYEEKSSMNRQSEWQILYKIAIGIARGLEYLHQGCATRILHFDIKPHNILLDENFCPKIVGFGLAKRQEKRALFQQWLQENEEENQQSRKFIASIWCIQTNPTSRPTISEVLEMLEGPLEAMQMPPEPFLYNSPSSRASSQ